MSLFGTETAKIGLIAAIFFAIKTDLGEGNFRTKQILTGETFSVKNAKNLGVTRFCPKRVERTVLPTPKQTVPLKICATNLGLFSVVTNFVREKETVFSGVSLLFRADKMVL